MNTSLLNQLKNTIEDKNKVPQSEELFAGANLIITNRQIAAEITHHKKTFQRDIFVVTEYSKELSWLVFQLKEIFADEINSMNKYQFYPLIGSTILKGMEQNKTLQGIIKAVIYQCEVWHDHYSNSVVKQKSLKV